MSTPVRFVDTNVLLYALSTDPGEGAKRDVAEALLEERDLALSVQVLQEFYVQATRSSRGDALDRGDAALLVEAFSRFPIAVTTPAVMRAAMDLCSRFSLSYWDAAIVEAARSLGCATVLSEDLGDGVDYAGVRVINPFRDVHDVSRGR